MKIAAFIAATLGVSYLVAWTARYGFEGYLRILAACIDAAERRDREEERG